MSLEKQTHSAPAILSFLIPTLGQFVKGHITKGFRFLLFIFVFNLISIPIFIFSLTETPIGILFSGFVVVCNIIIWIYQISDAYLTPLERKEDNKENIECPKCSTEISQDSKFCPECGIELERKEEVVYQCPKCSTEISQDSKFCPECGIEFEK